MRKPVFLVSNQVQHKAGCRTTEDGQWHEISHQGSSENRGTDQLQGYRTADLRLFFWHMQKADFLMMGLIF